MKPNCALVLFCLLLAAPASAVDTQDTRLLSEPSVSDSHIAFIYAGDLWVAGRDGSNVRRLTTHIGTESSPRFSPDGSLIAFSGQYDGNTDVFVINIAGGEPTRLTWHPGDDIAQGFTPDGARVLFISDRRLTRRGSSELYVAALEGGMPEMIPLPFVGKACMSPDGATIAYTPVPDVFDQWKHYRGGTQARIWIYDVADASVREIPKPDGGCNDTDPMWMDGRVFFRSDREGEFNLFVYDPLSGDTEQLTRFTAFPIVNATAGGNAIVFEQAGYLHLHDLGSGHTDRIRIGVAADLDETRPRYADGGSAIRSASISPSGARAVFEARGEIITVPREKGDDRNITGTPGVHERGPAWSPDGKSIAYVSDAGGEYRLHIAPQNGKGEVRILELEGSGFYEDLKWSPDGSRISYTDNSWSLYVITLAGGRVTRISSETLYGPIKTLHHAWSPDSRWLAYTRNTETGLQKVHLYSLDENKSHPITDGLSDVSEPVFDAGGNYLYFFASTEAGPVRQWFAMSTADFRFAGSLYLAVLPKGMESPLAPESDEEEGEEADPEAKTDEGDTPKVDIAFAGLGQRIVALPVTEGSYSNLQPGDEGQLFYLKVNDGVTLFDTRPATLTRFDLESREETAILEDVDAYDLSADHKKLLALSDGSWRIADASGPITSGDGVLATGGIRVRIDPRAEWGQIFGEAWRINRDYFYDPGMHGADWPGMRRKYEVFLDDLANRDDLNRVMTWMMSELSVGHHGLGGGDDPSEAERVPGGLLGADYEIADGRYRLARVYGGLNWNPDLRSPLTEPGVDAVTGEYLLAVNGVDLIPPANVHAPLENTAGRAVEITLGPNPGRSGSRTVTVVPIADEFALRNRAWVESNLERVHEATGGRVAYVHVPNTTDRGHEYFKRYFFSQVDKEAVIIDERSNGGGQVADYYINALRRPYISHWAMRYGQDLVTPQGAIQGPKVMLIDEFAASGGDLLPWMFRKLDMGPLVGKTTWGGLVGILGFPVLMDGGFVTAPNIGFWTQKDGWAVESEGVAPDIEVTMWPAEVMAGKDPQLEKAIEVALEMLAASPVSEPVRPPFPVRVKQ